MPDDTWTVVTASGAWSEILLPVFGLMTEAGAVLTTELAVALTTEDMPSSWATQSNGLTTWSVQ